MRGMLRVESSLMLRETSQGNGRWLIYLVGYSHSIFFAGLLGTKQRTGAYTCLSQSILDNRNVKVGSIF